MHRLPLTATVLLSILSPLSASEPTPAQAEYFEAKVRPVLVEHCIRCHGEKKQEAGLRLDSAAAVAKGADGGPVVVPGDPAKSGLVKAVRRETDAPMPPNKPLPSEAVTALTEWVRIGAPFPAADTAVQNAPAAAKSHWAFQPVRDPAVPAIRNPQSAVRSEVDAFVLARLEKAGLRPSQPADKRTLLRRAYFDLIGLPPTAAEVEAFEQNASPDAFAEVVDRLLASPRYGERWARHWLDIARYSDTKGYVFQEDRTFPYAYTYRDYVIRSLNEDKPYNRFVVEQLAADRLDLGDDKRPLAAMGFLTLGRRFLNNAHDIIDDRLDVVTRGFMGLTVTCARCHDHKYDPIPQADYYSLYGVFASSAEPKELPVIGTVERTDGAEAFDREVAKREKELADYRAKQAQFRRTLLGSVVGPGAVAATSDRMVFNRADRNEITRLERRIDSFKAASPFNPPRAMVLADLPRPVEPVVFLRGNPFNRGPRVPRQFPQVAAGPTRKPFTDGSGRLELANAIASPDNPLTARVIVNRLWAHHFGHGLVRTPSDFGTRSDPPTHPELLDWLAKRFVTDDGWSLKRLHRRIMLSATYQQSSNPQPEDPENRLLARFSRRRLDFEALRDAMLAAAGTLDVAKVGGRSVDLFKAPFPTRRSVYGFVDRQNLPGTLRAFDFASPDQHTPQRFQTTVPQQALFLMNSTFVAEQARALAARPDVAAADTPADTVRALYRAVLGRNPTAAEADLGAAFVAAEEPKPGSPFGPWEQYAQVLLLSNEFAFVD